MKGFQFSLSDTCGKLKRRDHVAVGYGSTNDAVPSSRATRERECKQAHGSCSSTSSSITDRCCCSWFKPIVNPNENSPMLLRNDDMYLILPCLNGPDLNLSPNPPLWEKLLWKWLSDPNPPPPPLWDLLSILIDRRSLYFWKAIRFPSPTSATSLILLVRSSLSLKWFSLSCLVFEKVMMENIQRFSLSCLVSKKVMMENIKLIVKLKGS